MSQQNRVDNFNFNNIIGGGGVSNLISINTVTSTVISGNHLLMN